MKGESNLNKTAISECSIVLIILQFFLALGAIFGGGMLVIDPSGDLLGLPLSFLEQSPFSSYFIPGIILFIVLGIVPVWIGIGLIRKKNSIVANKLNVFSKLHWSWSFSLYSGFALIIWIFVQTYFLQAVHLVHLFYFALGVVIQIVTMLPSVQRKYYL